jgi:hypothetical protein
MDAATGRRASHHDRVSPGRQCRGGEKAFAPGTPSALVFDVDAALTFEPRSRVIRFVRQDEGERLCGVGVPCPGS